MPTTSTTSWTKPWLGLAVTVFAVLGVISSIALLQSELKLLRDPDAALVCDVNPLIGCSKSLLAPQAHLLVIPNSAVGLILFGALAAFGLVLMFRAGLPRLIWWGVAAGAVGGLLFVSYFLYESIAVFRTLCPYCMLTWAATLAIVPLAIGGAASSGALGRGAQGFGRTTLKFWWAITLIFYLVVVLIVVIALSDKIGYLF